MRHVNHVVTSSSKLGWQGRCRFGPDLSFEAVSFWSSLTFAWGNLVFFRASKMQSANRCFLLCLVSFHSLYSETFPVRPTSRQGYKFSATRQGKFSEMRTNWHHHFFSRLHLFETSETTKNQSLCIYSFLWDVDLKNTKFSSATRFLGTFFLRLRREEWLSTGVSRCIKCITVFRVEKASRYVFTVELRLVGFYSGTNYVHVKATKLGHWLFVKSQRTQKMPSHTNIWGPNCGYNLENTQRERGLLVLQLYIRCPAGSPARAWSV